MTADLFLLLLAMAAAIGVLVSLGLGLFAALRGGEYGRANSNKMMRMRVTLQGVALAILFIAFLVKSQGG